MASAAFTEASATTVIGVTEHRKLSLDDLCVIIDLHSSMQRTEIVSAEGYKQWTGTVAHRFLVFELRRSGRKPIWLRVRRKGNIPFVRFLANGAKTPANDTVSLHIRLY